MPIPRPARPSALWADLRRFASGDQRHKLLIGIISLLMPALILYGFNRDARTNILPGRSITYIQSWPATRTDAEIVAQQKIDQVKREKQQAEKRAAYQRLAKQLGIE